VKIVPPKPNLIMGCFRSEVLYANCEGRPQRPPRPLPSGQAQRDRQKIREDISNPVWFVAEGEKLFLLPVHGSDTQWYRNVLKNPSIRIDARGTEAEFRAVPITDAKTVKSVIERFREKYGAGDVKKYYSKFDVAVLLETMRWPS
jgi:hypothetical protein